VRTVRLEIGVNGAFLTRRWEEPEHFMALTRECGYRVHEFCADVLDPFFSGDRNYQLEAAHQIREAAQKYDVVISDIYTGVATHRFHGLSHRHPAVRERMRQWILDCMDLAAAMGTARIGGHWDALSVETLSSPAATEAALQNLWQTFRELAVAAQEKGLAAISNEQMYIPSETPWTLAGAERFLAQTNGNRAGVPVYLTLDVGHMAGQSYGAGPPDTDYREWLRRFGAVSEIVHLQQTTPEASAHWPFTDEYNRRGHVRIPEVLDALRRSHAEFPASPLSDCLAPVSHTYLIAEIIPGSTKNEKTLLRELKESAAYLYQFVPESGMEFSAPE